MCFLRVLAFCKSVNFRDFYDDDQFCGVLYTADDNTYIFVLYLAVNDLIRSKGYGTKILDWLKQESVQISWRSGMHGSFTATLNTDNGKQWLVYFMKAWTVRIPFGWLLQYPPFDDKDKRVELLNKINEIPGVDWSETEADKWPTFSLAILNDPNFCQRFLGILTWIKQQIIVA